MSRPCLLICVTIFFLGFNSIAQDSISSLELIDIKQDYRTDSNSWSIEIPIWIPGFRGEFAYGEIDIVGQPENLPEEPGFGDTFRRFFNTKFGVNYFFLTSASYKKKRFLAEIDLFSGTLGSDIKFKYNDKTWVDASIHLDLARFSTAYNIQHDYLFNNKARNKLYVYGGIRMYYISVSSDLDKTGNTIKVDPFVVEPILGLRDEIEFKYWKFLLQCDMGSFGLNDKFSYMLSFYSYYRLSNLLSIKFGWNDLYLNYDDRFKNEDLKIKLHVAGPVGALVFHF